MAMERTIEVDMTEFGYPAKPVKLQMLKYGQWKQYWIEIKGNEDDPDAPVLLLEKAIVDAPFKFDRQSLCDELDLDAITFLAAKYKLFLLPRLTRFMEGVASGSEQPMNRAGPKTKT